MVEVNGVSPDDVTDDMDMTTVYISPLITLRKDEMTKHIFLNGQRIASKVGHGLAEITGTPAGNSVVNYAARIQQVNNALLDDIEELDIDVSGVSWNNYGYYSDGNGQNNYFGDGGSSGMAETEVYYFHPDHLGSSTFLSDKNGDAYQHFAYLPFGEILAENQVSSFTDYKFNGKEQDQETGLYYYGARYYDPVSSIWLSTDPLAADYASWSPYNYVLGNPIRLIDPDGRAAVMPGGNPLSYVSAGFGRMYNAAMASVSGAWSATYNYVNSIGSGGVQHVEGSSTGVFVESDLSQYSYQGNNQYVPSSEPALDVSFETREFSYSEAGTSVTVAPDGVPMTMGVSHRENSDGSTSTTTTTSVGTTEGPVQFNAYAAGSSNTSSDGSRSNSVSAGGRAEVILLAYPEANGSTTTHSVSTELQIKLTTTDGN